MRRLALLALTSVAVLVGTHASASAMIAIDVLRGPLRTAAQAAASCEGVTDGRYLVHLRIDGEGQGSEAELRGAPEGLPPNTAACIERAFDAQPYPSLARGRVGGIQITYPFVVDAHGSKHSVSRSGPGRSR